MLPPSNHLLVCHMFRNYFQVYWLHRLWWRSYVGLTRLQFSETYFLPFLEIGMEIIFFIASGISSNLQDVSKIIGSDLAMTSASSLSTLGCDCPTGLTDLCPSNPFKCSLNLTPLYWRYVCLAPDLPTGLRDYKLRQSGKEEIQCLHLFHVLYLHSPSFCIILMYIIF